MLPPAFLVRAFGRAGLTKSGFDSSGEFDFEDSNLDLYTVMEYKQT